MRHQLLAFLSVFLLVSGAASAIRAQNNASGEAAPTAGQSSVTNGPAVAHAPAAPKKVWTNDEVTGLRGESVISTVGSTDAKPGSKPEAVARNKNANAYQAQIARLEAQIPVLDSQIAELQSAINGKPTGDGKDSQRPRGVKADDWSMEMQQLQKKRDGILDQIGALKDRARHQGVPGNALP
jgi:hypothetical protein